MIKLEFTTQMKVKQDEGVIKQSKKKRYGEMKRCFEALEEVVKRMDDAFEKWSKGKPYFGGDKIGYVDVVFGCFLGWLSVIENKYDRKVLIEEKAHNLVKWAKRFIVDCQRAYTRDWETC